MNDKDTRLLSEAYMGAHTDRLQAEIQGLIEKLSSVIKVEPERIALVLADDVIRFQPGNVEISDILSAAHEEFLKGKEEDSAHPNYDTDER